MKAIPSGLAPLAAGLAALCLWTAPSAAQDAGRVPVAIHRVTAEQAQAGLTGLGSVRCRHTMELSFEQPGLIAEVAVEEGQLVKRGQVLARLDDRVLKAESAARLADLAAQETEAARLSEKKAEKEKLFQSRAITQADLRDTGFELDKAKARLEAARAESRALAAKLAGTVLKAPVDGVILKREMEVGEVASPGQRKTLKLGQCATVLAEVEFGEKLYSRLTPGLEVGVSADALPGRQFRGVVESVSPEVDPKNRTFMVKARVPNADLSLKPGMFVRAQVRVEAPAAEQSIWIPREALAADQGQRGEVMAIEDRKAVKRQVVLGRREGRRVEVLSGLKPGDQIILSGESGAPAPEPGRP